MNCDSLPEPVDRDLAFDVSSAVVATGSGVTGWAVWGTGPGRYVWAGIAAIASILAILKPILGTHRKAQQFGKMDEGWHGFYLAVERLVSQILIDDRVTQTSERRIAAVQNRYEELSRADTKSHSEPQRVLAPKTASPGRCRQIVCVSLP